MVNWITPVIGLAAVYLIALGHAGAGDIALGCAWSLAILWAFDAHIARRAVVVHLVRRAVWFMPFAAVVVAGSVRGGIITARRIVRGGTRPPSCFARVPIGDRTPTGVAVSSLCVCLTPGTVLVDIEASQRMMVFHLAAGDPLAFAREQTRFYDRWQRHVFP